MNTLKKSWAIVQKSSLAMGVPVLLLLGLRIEEDDSAAAFAQNTMLAFVLLTAILGLLAWGAYEELGLLWPGAVALAFLAVFGSALFRIKPTAPDQEATATAAPRGRTRTP